MRNYLAGAAAYLIAIIFASGAIAQTATPTDSLFGKTPHIHIDEIRLGLLYHEDSRFKRIFSGDDTPREGGLADITAEILFERPSWDYTNPFVNWLLRPRFRLGGTQNIGDGTSHFSVGFAWDQYLTRSIFLENSFDLAVHNGRKGGIPRLGRRRLGCNPLFRQSMSLGHDVSEHWRVMLTVEHLDNFGLCTENAGLTNIGARLGYRF